MDEAGKVPITEGQVPSGGLLPNMYEHHLRRVDGSSADETISMLGWMLGLRPQGYEEEDEEAKKKKKAGHAPQKGLPHPGTRRPDWNDERKQHMGPSLQIDVDFHIGIGLRFPV